MDYDFAVDTAKIDSLISVINGNITQIDNMIKQLYEECAYPLNKLDSLNYWKGEVYTAFKTKMESFRDGTFAEIKQELDVWSGKFSEAQQKSSQLTSTLTSEW